LAKGEAGILERPPAPTLKEFSPRFESAIVTLCAEKPAMVDFYRKEMWRLLEDRQLSAARSDAIDEGMITDISNGGLVSRPDSGGRCRPHP
jgi:hypothetical protein